MKPRSNSQSTTLNLWLINQLEQEESKKRATNKWALENMATVNGALPVVSGAGKWANTSINHNLKCFLKQNDLVDSRNPLNDHSAFEDFPILFEGWVDATERPRISPRRKLYDSQVLFAQFQCIFSVCSFDPNNPICIDRHGRLLDGFYRMYTMAVHGGRKVYIRQYDFE